MCIKHKNYFQTNIQLTTFNKNESIENNIFNKTDINLTKCYFDGNMFYAMSNYMKNVKYGYLSYTIIYSNALSFANQNNIYDRLKKYERYYLKTIKYIDNRKIDSKEPNIIHPELIELLMFIEDKG